ncbi:sperm-specific protein PHI-2B/PHI-3-like isoform X1 [Argiope bruennichi]|uniref:sperm-specific protein PHI-2B/PHI-3-like isoform X1 n=1 Tax=Argiope bruennichi TaxID=94029 RepID=UPI002493EBF3|nr:sperm-specific protein PHI-2B/PHI-3-like isoform X1 [Argiope bruennichi]
MDSTLDIKVDPDFEADVRNRILAFVSSKNEPTFKKVEKAISIIENDGKNASVTAIVNWILSNYSILDPQKLKLNVKKAILKGLKDGMFIRAVGSRKALGTAGSFSLSSKKNRKKKASKYEKSVFTRKILPLTMTKDGLLVQKPRANGIKRKISVSNATDKMLSQKHLCKSSLKESWELSETVTKLDFKFLPTPTSFENHK